MHIFRGHDGASSRTYRIKIPWKKLSVGFRSRWRHVQARGTRSNVQTVYTKELRLISGRRGNEKKIREFRALIPLLRSFRCARKKKDRTRTVRIARRFRPRRETTTNFQGFPFSSL